jgi:hypothetical protein
MTKIKAVSTAMILGRTLAFFEPPLLHGLGRVWARYSLREFSLLIVSVHDRWELKLL